MMIDVVEAEFGLTIHFEGQLGFPVMHYVTEGSKSDRECLCLVKRP